MIDVSIVIINYNSDDLLSNCLSSFYKTASGYNFEVIVVDNSNENYHAREIVLQYPHTKFIKNKTNLGFSLANNKGIDVSEGKYIVIMNNDIIFTENTFKVLLEYCEASDQDLMVGCELLNPDGTHQVSIVEFDRPWNIFTESFFLYKLFPKSRYFNKYYQNYITSSEPFETDVIKGAFMFCNGTLVRELKGFDPNFFFYYEETDLCYMFKKHGGKIIYYPGTSVIHLGGATTDNMPWFKFKSQTVSRIKFFQKHFTGPKFVLSVLLHYTGVLIRIPLYLMNGLLTRKKFHFYKAYYYFKQLFIYSKYSHDLRNEKNSDTVRYETRSN